MAYATPALLMLMFFTYPLVTNIAFEAFPCHAFTEGDGTVRSWLRADVEVECDTAEHRRVIAIAVLAILIYPVGLPVLCAALLVRARAAIPQGQAGKGLCIDLRLPCAGAECLQR